MPRKETPIYRSPAGPYDTAPLIGGSELHEALTRLVHTVNVIANLVMILVLLLSPPLIYVAYSKGF